MGCVGSLNSSLGSTEEGGPCKSNNGFTRWTRTCDAFQAPGAPTARPMPARGNAPGEPQPAMSCKAQERQRRDTRQPGATPRVNSNLRCLAWPGSANGATQASPGQRPGFGPPTTQPSPERAAQTMAREQIPNLDRPFRACAFGSEKPGALPRAALRLPRWGAQPTDRGRGGPCLPRHEGRRRNPNDPPRKRRGTQKSMGHGHQVILPG